ncbi:pyrroline-5-carboxylate reductase [Streptomyces sp. NPDC052496]|uniref:pyrroline-5-carboxylate reductase n=1 Tax=Streptomyces sp. NPDC052496 TaxID=3154951 RepID=UPI00344648E5
MITAARTVIVGCGHMGLGIAKGLRGASPDRRLLAVDISAERREELARSTDLHVAAELETADTDLVVLAIPPQDFDAFALAERHQFGPGTPVLSVMAGLTADSISKALGTSQVVRSIPNTPSEVSEGMSVYYAGPAVSQETLAQADELLSTIGRALRVDTEELIDDATAICGGGPAFVSYLLDAFCRFGVERGFTEAASREMAFQVFGGTAKLVAEVGKPPMQLCREVMTPNGTTERGIAAFEAAGLQGSLRAGLSASAHRSRELAHLMSGGVEHGKTDD